MFDPIDLYEILWKCLVWRYIIAITSAASRFLNLKNPAQTKNTSTLNGMEVEQKSGRKHYTGWNRSATSPNKLSAETRWFEPEKKDSFCKSSRSKSILHFREWKSGSQSIKSNKSNQWNQANQIKSNQIQSNPSNQSNPIQWNQIQSYQINQIKSNPIQ